MVVVIVLVVVVAVVGHLCVLHWSVTSESSSSSRRNCGGGRLDWLHSGVVLVVGEVVLVKTLGDVFRNTGFERHHNSIYSTTPTRKTHRQTNKQKQECKLNKKNW